MIIDSNLLVESKYNDLIYFKYLENLRDAIVSSQKSWIELRNRNSEIMGLKYKGGSMEAMARNIQIIADTKNRIKFIDEIE